MSIGRICLLGHPEVSFEGRPVRFRIKKALALLYYLAAEGGGHPRRELAELLWPQSDERRARTALRSALAHLRKALGEDRAHDEVDVQENHILFADGDLLGVEPRGIDLDLRTLEAAVELSRGEAPGTSPRGSGVDGALGRRGLMAHLEEASEVYRGEFMEGFSLEDAPEFELWLEAQRTRWRALFGELCERLSRLEGEEGLVGEAIGTARLWARHAPLEEAAQRRLMELLSGAGESERALLAYEGFRNTLKRELQMEPSSWMQEHAASLREEVEERAYLGASFVRSAATPTISSQLSVLEVPLVGRQEELGTLVSEYHAARQGESRVVAVLGEAGIGKTRLAQEAVTWARSRGADVLEGRASEGAGGLSYGPLVEALRPRMERERAPDDLLEDTWLAELSRLLPELKERYPDLPPPASSEGGETAKGVLFEAIARLVEALTSGAPVVLFLEDLQWSDTATLEVLEYAGRRWAEQGAPVLMLITARPEDTEVSSAFQKSLLSLGRRLPVRSLTLGRLAEEDVEELLRRLATRESSSSRPTGALEEVVGGSNTAESGFKRLGEQLASETEGQPFYLVETLKAMLEVGMLLIRRRADGEIVVEVGPAWRTEKSALRNLLPKSVREVIRSRLSRLSPAAAELLRAGAVLDRGFGFESVARMADLGEAEALGALEELIERRLLLEDVGGGEEGEVSHLFTEITYSFSHEKIRQVAYTEAGRARRRVLHRRAFEELEEGGAPAAQLARHALAGGLAEQAFGYSVAAGDRAMEVFAVRDAIVHYERARNLLAGEVRTASARQPVEPSIPALEHLYTQLGGAYELAKDWEKARAAYEAMRALGRELGEARLEVVALNLLAILTFHQEASPSRVRRLLEEARRVAEEAGLEEALVETECNLADVMSYWTGEHEHSAPLARKALASARALEEERPDLIVRALWTLARLELIWGSLAESAAYAEEGAALSRELVKRRPPRRMLLPSMGPAATGFLASWRAGAKAMEIQCLRTLAYARILQGRLGEGIRTAREVLGMSRQLHERAEALASWVLGLGLSEIGEYEEALEFCRRGTELARKLPNPFLLWLNLDHLGWAYEAMLGFEEARKIHEEALDLRGTLGPQCERSSSIRLCAVAALSENWEDAYAHAKRAHQSRTSLDVLGSLSLHFEVEALLRGGDERSAREEVRLSAERGEVNERERMAYLRSVAVLSEFAGDTHKAIKHLHEALTLAERIGLPSELWQIRSKVGELHERRGEAELSQEAFSEAAQTLRMLAQKIEDEKLREGFLSATRVRRVLGRDQATERPSAPRSRTRNNPV